MKFRYALLVAVVIAILAGWLAWPIWLQLVVSFVAMFALAAGIDLHRHLARRRKVNRLTDQPIVLDEDGTLHIPVLHPGESVHVVVDETDGGGELGRVHSARIVRPDGTVRTAADWSARH
jgi:hypothetical protein